MIYINRFAPLAGEQTQSQYPFGLPLLANLGELWFDAPVTILAGDNGSGKTTLLELIAVKAGAVRIGSGQAARDGRSAAIREASAFFRITRKGRPNACFFFTAEDFSRELETRAATRRDAEENLARVRREYEGRDYALGYAVMPFERTLNEMDSQFQRELALRSHGEGFLDFFGARLVPNGLYLLDEPEAALTYFNQLVLLNMVREAVERGCQFIIATHSPVLCACPGAVIFQLEEGGPRETQYDDLADIQFLKLFLRDRERLLRD